MKIKGNPPSTVDPIKNLIQDAFGMSARECLKEFQDAQENPDTSADAKAPSGGGQRLIDRIELEEIPSYADLNRRRNRRLKKLWRPLIAAAIIGSVIWGFGIGASGHKFYGYRPSAAESDRYDVIWDNDENLVKVSSEEEAYQEIKEELGIDVLCLSYMPYSMKFDGLHWSKGYAIMDFEYDEKKVYLVQAKSNEGKSDNYIFDHTEKKSIYSEWLSEWIKVYHVNTKDGNDEYEATIEMGGAVYHLVGTIDDENVFYELVENLQYYYQ